MSEEKQMQSKLSVEKAYLSHILRYVGVGLISGSIVHAGTLGGGSLRYAILISMGVIGFTVGTLLEKNESSRSLTAFIVVSVIMSIGVGMVSGGTQHYLDGPFYASILIPLGIAIGYFAFLFRDHKSEATTKRIIMMPIIALSLMGILYMAAQRVTVVDDHHSLEVSEQNVIYPAALPEQHHSH